MPASAASSTSPNAMRAAAVDTGFDISGPFQRPVATALRGWPGSYVSGGQRNKPGFSSRGSCAGQVSFLTTLQCSRGDGLGVAMEPVMEPLKFVALDPDDLEV